MLQVVENHVAVEHLGVAVQTVFGKAIVVVPRLHIGNHRFDVSIVLSGILIVLQHLTHVFFAESQHSVEFRFGTDVPADVESAGEVIERDGADAGHEDALEHALEHLEYITVEAAGVGERVISFVTLLVEHYIGEVIIFVDDEVETGAAIPGLSIQKVDFGGGIGLLFHFLLKAGVVISFVNEREVVQSTATVVVEIYGQPVRLSADAGKVERQNLVGALQGCRVLAYPQVTEPGLELRLLRDVVVGPQHTQEDAFTEAPGTDEEQATRLLLQ